MGDLVSEQLIIRNRPSKRRHSN